MTAIPGTGLLISIDYDGSALQWARMFDNSLIGWLVDDDMETDPPLPIAIGSLPPEAADTAPVLSPQWALVENDAVVLVPDKFRGTVDEFFTWLATNNGATRKIDADFGVSNNLFNAFNTWKQRHPTQVQPPP